MFGPAWKAAVEATLRIAPLPAPAHRGQDEVAELGQRADVEVDHLALAVERPVGEPAGEAEAGIVDQRLDAQALRPRTSAIRLSAAPGQGEVGGEDMDVAAELGLQRLEPVAAPGDQHQLLAARAALAREFGAEPRRRAGDERDGPRHGRQCGRNEALTIFPGWRGGSPLGSASTCSMPSVTSPHTVYWPSRKPPSSKQMKNWLLALFGSLTSAPSRRCRGRAARR